MSDSPPDEFEQSLQELERSLAQLKARYQDIRQQEVRQQYLNDKQRDLRDRITDPIDPALAQEQEEIEQQLQELSLGLESRLLSDPQQKQLLWEFVRSGLIGEVFWQIVRFGGLGVVLGWLLKTWAG